MTVPKLILPTGEEAVTMTAEEYEDLIDARDHAQAMREIAAGTMPMVPNEAVDAYLAAPTPLAFWRGHRGLTQVELADSAGISQAYLSLLENGEREAVPSVYRRLAERLRVRIGDLLE